MKSAVILPKSLSFSILLALFAALSAAPNARANVYASNIKLNGNLSSVTNGSGTPVTISYILNEPASLGTTVKILSGTNVVDTISVAAGNSGTLLGTNSVVWGGTNSQGGNVGGGTYLVSITPGSSGYTNWTQTTVDSTSNGTYINWPAGIAVNCNTNSLYYGRIMVANSGPNSSGPRIGDTNGVIKLNADGSFADEGQGNAGYPFNSDNFLGDTPRRGRIADDDRFYFNDWSGNGKIVAVDMRMTSNQVILDSINFTGNDSSGNWPEFDVTGVGTTNARVYLADVNFPGSQGVWSWTITNNGAANSPDEGMQVIQADGNNTPGTDIPGESVYGLMLDSNNDIFIGNIVQDTGDPLPRATCITNWPSSTNQPLYTNNILWQVGRTNDTFLYISDLAIDSRANPHYVACAMNGGAGGIRVLNAADGSLVTNIQQNANNFCISVAWDNVGNVYAGNGIHFWRAYSPPGTNQATTVAVETIQVTAPSAPLVITSISPATAFVGFNINFTGDTNDVPAGLKVYSSPTVKPAASYSINTNATIITLSPGVFRAQVPVSGSQQFYRIARQ